MRKMIDKIFLSDKMMKLSLLLMLAAWIGSNYWYIFVRQKLYPLVFTVQLLSVLYGIIILYTYKTHDKNIMKPAIGMLMGALSMYALVNICQNLFEPNIYADYFNRGFRGYFAFFLDMLQCVLFFVFSIMHLAMNKTHESSPRLVDINRGIIAVLIFILAAQMILCNFRYNIGRAVALAVMHFGLINLTLLVCCVESKIDYFRARREENGREEKQTLK